MSREFPSDEALKTYLKEHPHADKSKHTVKPTEEEAKKKKDEGAQKWDAEFSQALKDHGISQNQVKNWAEKTKKDLDKELPGSHGEKSRKEDRSKEFDKDLRNRFHEEGIPEDHVKKWIEQQKKELGLTASQTYDYDYRRR